ncbi:MAG: hypothetical protein KGL48_14740 [Sphingomonadales bacterium]|nr:hypothetical protein [Sphingomonadales bacterium]MDE2570560.1 hypothetical protein [Sphingomonadales bacterium]
MPTKPDENISQLTDKLKQCRHALIEAEKAGEEDLLPYREASHRAWVELEQAKRFQPENKNI